MDNGKNFITGKNLFNLGDQMKLDLNLPLFLCFRIITYSIISCVVYTSILYICCTYIILFCGEKFSLMRKNKVFDHFDIL